MTSSRFHSLPAALMDAAQKSELRLLDVCIRQLNTLQVVAPKVSAINREIQVLKIIVEQGENPEERAALFEMLRGRVLELQRQLVRVEDHAVDVVDWPGTEDLQVLEAVVLHYQKTLAYRVGMLLNPFCHRKEMADQLAAQCDAVSSLDELLVWVRSLEPGLVTSVQAYRAAHVLARAISGAPLLDLSPQS